MSSSRCSKPRCTAARVADCGPSPDCRNRYLGVVSHGWHSGPTDGGRVQGHHAFGAVQVDLLLQQRSRPNELGKNNEDQKHGRGAGKVLAWNAIALTLTELLGAGTMVRASMLECERTRRTKSCRSR